MNVDPDGHAWWNVLAWIGLGLVAVAAVVLTLGVAGFAVGGAGLTNHFNLITNVSDVRMGHSAIAQKLHLFYTGFKIWIK